VREDKNDAAEGHEEHYQPPDEARLEGADEQENRRVDCGYRAWRKEQKAFERHGWKGAGSMLPSIR
jgi:hypothetical protein